MKDPSMCKIRYPP